MDRGAWRAIDTMLPDKLQAKGGSFSKIFRSEGISDRFRTGSPRSAGRPAGRRRRLAAGVFSENFRFDGSRSGQFVGAIAERGNTFLRHGIDGAAPARWMHHAHEHPGDQARPRPPCVAETAVQTEDHHRSAAAGPHDRHQPREKVDVVQLTLPLE